MLIKELELEGVFEVTLNPIGDERGFFMRTYDNNILKSAGVHRDWVQENQSWNSTKNTIRGLHFQYPPDTETKLVRVIEGEIYDVFVDLRKESKTFGKWGSTILSSDNKKMLCIPRGFAHGMCTLSDNATMLYKVDNYYAPDNEGEIKWNDPDLGIKWPSVDNPTISDKDTKAGSFKDFLEKFGGFE